jgi:hypothetical protein
MIHDHQTLRLSARNQTGLGSEPVVGGKMDGKERKNEPAHSTYSTCAGFNVEEDDPTTLMTRLMRFDSADRHHMILFVKRGPSSVRSRTR